MEELLKSEIRNKINDKMYCNEHSGKKLKVYCETCDQLICRDCIDFKHVKQGHSCVLVKDVANNYKDLLASNDKAMEDALTEGNVFLQRLTLTTQQLDRDAENVKNKIAQRKEFVEMKVIEMLNQKAENLCKKVDEIHKGERANLDRQAEETKLYLKNIKTSLQLSKTLVDQGTEEEIFFSQKMMLDNANNLLTNREEYFKAPIHVAKLNYTSSIGKEPINEDILRGLSNSLGEVHEEYFKAPIPVAKLNYTSSSVKESINEEILRGLANNLGEVNEASNDTGKKPIHNGGGGGKRRTLDKCGHSFCIIMHLRNTQFIIPWYMHTV
jgi:hypothetical protein